MLNPWNLDQLAEIEAESGQRVWTVLQLRVHPALVALRERLLAEPGRRHAVRLTYVTTRGTWYRYSWKGDAKKSGGVATNIGVHFFDLLQWLFGEATGQTVNVREPTRAAGTLDAAPRRRAVVHVARRRRPAPSARGAQPTYRSITVDGEEIEFSGGFRDLHTLVYERTLAGRRLRHRGRAAVDRARPRDPPRARSRPRARRPPVRPLGGPERRGARVVSAPDAGRQTAIPGVRIHESAYVDAGAEIGEGSAVWHFAHVQSGARIGRGCSFGQNVNVGADVVVGDRVKVQNNVSIYTGTTVEDDVFLGPSCVLTNVTNPRSQVARRALYEPTRLRRGATVGANATVVCGVTLGRYCFVAAGAVVTRDVPDYALVVGTPARRAGWMSRHGHRLDFRTPDGGDTAEPGAQGVAVCPESGLRYALSAEGTRPLSRSRRGRPAAATRSPSATATTTASRTSARRG